MSGKFYAGTSNLVFPIRTKSFLPAEFQTQTRLTNYATLFNSVEINASFYRMPRLKTIRKWETEAGDYFRFSFKLIQDITHTLNNQFELSRLPDFLTAIAIEKRGCLLVQLPPKFGPDLIQLEILLNALKHCGWRVAIEFRHPGWYRDKVFDRLDRGQAAMVIHDLKKSASPLNVTSDTVYLRFHGPKDGYRGSYSDDFLSEYATYITEWLTEGKTVFAYFNNALVRSG